MYGVLGFDYEVAVGTDRSLPEPPESRLARFLSEVLSQHWIAARKPRGPAPDKPFNLIESGICLSLSHSNVRPGRDQGGSPTIVDSRLGPSLTGVSSIMLFNWQYTIWCQASVGAPYRTGAGLRVVRSDQL